MESTLFLVSLYLGLAVVVVPLAVRLGLGSVLGYLAAGILLGPVLGLAGAETAALQHVAEFGVVMMLFLIGLELDPRGLWAMRRAILGLGAAQVVLSAAALGGILFMLGSETRGALAMGLILALSSTAIVLQTLTEKRLLRTPGGKSSFAVLLTQDMAVVPILAALPLLARSLPRTAEADHAATETAAEPLVTLVQSLSPWGAAALTLAVVAAIVLGGHFLSRPVFRFVHASRLPEMSTFVSLALVTGIAFLMALVGLSPALGTFLAGVVLANSEFRHQIEADIRPFKGLLLGVFFMTVGIGIDLRQLVDEPLRILSLVALLLAAKSAVLFAIATVARLKRSDRWLFTLGLAQGGEFGFVLASTALAEQALTAAEARTVTLVISLSMLVTPLLFLAADALSRRRAAPEPARDPDRVDERGRVLIAGIGRFGQVVNRLVRSAGLSTVVLDADMSTIETMRRFGVKGFFGDPSRPELLEAAGLDEADVLVVAVDDRENANQIVRFARHRRPDLHIVARARDRVHVYELYQAGANDIVRETFDSSVRAGRYVLENTGFSDYEAAVISQTYYKVDRAAMKDLAAVWVPGQPVHLNEAYVARARKLDRDLETALIEALDDGAAKAAE